MSYREPPRRMSPWAALAIAQVSGVTPLVLLLLGQWRWALAWIGALVVIGLVGGVGSRRITRKAPDPKIEGLPGSGDPPAGDRHSPRPDLRPERP